MSQNLGSIYSPVELQLDKFNRQLAEVKRDMTKLGEGFKLSPRFDATAAKTSAKQLTAALKAEADVQNRALAQASQKAGTDFKKHLADQLAEYKKYAAGWKATQKDIATAEAKAVKDAEKLAADKKRILDGLQKHEDGLSKVRIAKQKADTDALIRDDRRLTQESRRQSEERAKAREDERRKAKEAREATAREEKIRDARKDLGDKAIRGAQVGAVATGLATWEIAKSGMQYDRSARYAATNVDLSEAEIKQARSLVMGLTNDRRVLAKPNDLMQGLYQITGTADFATQFRRDLASKNPTPQAMDILRYGAMAATAGDTDVATALDPGLSAMAARLKGARNARETYDTIFQGVKVGKMEFNQLSGLGGLFVAGRQANASLPEIMAGMAQQTTQGMPVSEAATAMKNFLFKTVKPTPAVTSAMDQLGIKYGSQAIPDSGGLEGYLRDIQDRMEAFKATGATRVNYGVKGARSFKTTDDLYALLFPELRAMTAGNILRGGMETSAIQNMLDPAKGANFSTYMAGMRTARDGGGALARSTGIMSAGPAAQFDRVIQQFERVKILLAEGVTPGLTKFGDTLEWVMKKFSALPEGTQARLGAGIMGTAVGLGSVAIAGPVIRGFKEIAELFAKANLAPKIAQVGGALSGFFGAILKFATSPVGTAIMAAYAIYKAPAVARETNRQLTEEEQARLAKSPNDAKGRIAEIDRLLGTRNMTRPQRNAAYQALGRQIHGRQATDPERDYQRALRDGVSDSEVDELIRERGILRRGMHTSAGGAGSAGALNVTRLAEGIKTPLGEASCAYFASQLLQRTGIRVPTIPGAKALTDRIVGMGAKPVPDDARKAGDLVTWRGEGYGSLRFNEGGKKVGYHVGVVDQDGNVIQSSSGRVSTRPFSDGANATVYRIPAGATPGAGSTEDVAAGKSSMFSSIYGGGVHAVSVPPASGYSFGDAVPTREEKAAVRRRESEARKAATRARREQEKQERLFWSGFDRKMKEQIKYQQDAPKRYRAQQEAKGRELKAIREDDENVEMHMGQYVDMFEGMIQDELDTANRADAAKARRVGRDLKGAFSHAGKVQQRDAIRGIKTIDTAFGQQKKDQEAVAETFKDIGKYLKDEQVSQYMRKIGEQARVTRSYLTGMFDGMLQSGKFTMKSLFDDFQSMIRRMIATALASKVTDYLFGKQDAKGGRMGGALGSLFGLLGKKPGGRAEEAPGATNPAAGKGSNTTSILNTVGTLGGVGPVGSILGGIKKIFRFDDPVNDRAAVRWGADFAHFFAQGVDQGGTMRSGGGRGAPAGGGKSGGAINVTHIGDINNRGDLANAQSEIAWGIAQQLPVTHGAGV